jgi:hypothetical protein
MIYEYKGHLQKDGTSYLTSACHTMFWEKAGMDSFAFIQLVANAKWILRLF